MSKSDRLLTSLLLVEERILEAGCFVRLMRGRDSPEFGYFLNAFLSSSRSVTFLIQKEMSKVPGFDAWWSEQRQAMANDPGMHFFLKLRNFSQKEGRISLAGVRIVCGKQKHWSYRFAGTDSRVPAELLYRDVSNCCAEHLAKLIDITLACAEYFPFHSCPRRALTPEGVQQLGLTLHDIAIALGYDSTWIDAGSSNLPLNELLRLLRAQVDALDFSKLGQLSRRLRKMAAREAASDLFGDTLCNKIVDQLEGNNRQVDMRMLLAESLLRNNTNFHE